MNGVMIDTENLEQLAQLAERAALEAGECILTHRHAPVRVSHKAAGDSPASQVVTEVDHKAQAIILGILAPSLEDYRLALLTEETPDDGGRLREPAFWCIDPMDGTLAFVEDIPGFAVSIGLVSRSGQPLLGVAYDPLGDRLYRAVRGSGAYCSGRKLDLPLLDRRRPLVLRTDVSFRGHPWLDQTRVGLQRIAADLGLPGAEIDFKVGAVMNACGILQDANTCYFKYPRKDESGGSLWDYAATACLMHELGGVACDLYGRPLQLNREGSTFMNHEGVLYAGHAPIATRILGLHRDLRERLP